MLYHLVLPLYYNLKYASMIIATQTITNITAKTVISNILCWPVRNSIQSLILFRIQWRRNAKQIQ